MTVSPLAELLSRKRLLIFDLDGTLVDSSPLHARAFSEAFAPHGIEVDYATIAGMTTAAAVDQVAARAGLSLAPEQRSSLIRDKRERALSLIQSELTAIDGAVEFVSAARRRFRMALCSSGSSPSVSTSLQRVGLGDAFDPVVTAEDVSNSKPDPEGLLKALAHHGCRADEALVFEDADSGMAAASSAGIEAVRIAAGDSVATDGMAWAPLLRALQELGG